MLCGTIFWRLSVLYATASAAVVHPYVLEARGNSTDGEGDCELGGGAPSNSSRSAFGVLPEVFSLDKRAPTAQPLKTPQDFDGDTDKFLEYLQTNSQGDNDIDITPTDAQLDTWKVAGSRGQDPTPVGATAIWFPFGNSVQTWKMRGLRGCTASLVVSQSGLWASHLWESTKVGTNNGGSAFKERKSDTVVVVRPLSMFKKLAVDILGEVTPATERQNRERWTSLADLADRFGDPFSDSDQTKGYLLTKARSANSQQRLYPGQIDMLTKKYTDELSINMPTSTYIGTVDQYPADFPQQLIGVLGMQYTPCQRIEDGKCIARFEAYTENIGEANIAVEWTT